LPSVGWCTGQSGAPSDSHCSCPVRDLLPYLARPTVGPRGRLAHQTVRCTPDSPVCPTDRCCGPRVARGLRSRPLALATIAPLDSPVNYSRTPLRFPESSRFTAGQPGAPDTVRCTTGQSGVPGQSWCWLHTSNSFPFLFFFFCHCF
jgi:hypothetical protein